MSVTGNFSQTAQLPAAGAGPSLAPARWLGPLPIPGGGRRAALRVCALAARACTDWRWLPVSVAVGVLPFLASWLAGVRGHQALSAILLVPLCMSLALADRWRAALGVLLSAYAAHGLAVICASLLDPAGMAPILPGASDYWLRQQQWIRSGWDPEYQMANWIPAHLQLFFVSLPLSYLSLGGIVFFQGFYELDLMNFYVAQLSNCSVSPALALLLGWHIWSVLRGIGYMFVTLEVLSCSLQRLLGRPLATREGRMARGCAGVVFLLADGLAKAYLLEPVRSALANNLVQ